MANEKRLIDANDLWHKTFICDEPAEVRKFIENAPTVDAVEVVHGRWKKHKCTNCGCTEPGYYDYIEDCIVYEHTNYCPNCGAKMDGDGDG